MAASVEKMNTECEESKSKKGKRASRGKNDSITVKPKEKQRKEAADKENRGLPTPKQRGRKKETLKNVSNLLPAPLSLEDELLAVRMRLQKLNMEKERTDKLLEERDAMLKQKEAELEIKAKAQEKLQLQLKKFQKLKEFKPVLSFPLEQSLRMGEHAKEQENKKKKTNPNRLKKPSPPYILWCQEQWNQMTTENSNHTLKDMEAIMGAKWEALNAEEKKPYEEKYEAEKEVYLQVVGQEKHEIGALELLHEEQKQKTALDLLKQYFQYKKDAERDDKGKRRERDSSKPKQPVTFTNEPRAALLEQNHNVLEILGNDWNNMTKEERAPYEQIAVEAKEHYLQEMELYKKKKAEEASSISKEEDELRKLEKEQALRLSRKKEKAEILKKERDEEMLAKERPDISNTTISALISVKWKELGDADKKYWDDQAASAMMQYKNEMEEYNKSEGANTKSDPLQ